MAQGICYVASEAMDAGCGRNGPWTESSHA